MIIVGSISVVYCMCAVNNVRIILRRETLIKKIFWGILLDFLIPVLICFIILSIATGNWEDALIVLQEERRKCIILVLFIIFSNAIIVFAVGYCMVYSFQKDLIEKNRRNKRKEMCLQRRKSGSVYSAYYFAYSGRRSRYWVWRVQKNG